MANFSALKVAIQNAIKQNGNEEITGNVLQQILLSVVNTMGDGAINTIEQNLSDETLTRQNADNTLQQNIDSEVGARKSADNTLQSHIDEEALTRENADTQLQNVINAIKSDIDNGYVYAGIATPTTTPVSGKVFYIATAAGTYTNFGGQVLTQGINILRFNGSAWSSQQLIGIDDVPTAGSRDLVESGGVANITNPLNADVESVIKIERGGLRTDSGIEQNDAAAKGRRARTTYLQTPFKLKINSGFRIGAVLKYRNDNGTYTFISSQAYAATAPFVTSIDYLADDYVYRILITKEDASQDFTDAEILAILNDYAGSYELSNRMVPLIKTMLPKFGKYSIIGDSISSYKGNTISGYPYFYPNGDVNNVHKTWWEILRYADSDNDVLVNASYSGSFVIKKTDDVPSFYESVSLLGSTPNTIFVAIGTNDSSYDSPMGNYDFDKSISELSETEFIPAYTKGIKGLMSTYPNAKIICLAFEMKQAYKTAISNICDNYGLTFIECPTYTLNSDIFNPRHPNERGMADIVTDIYQHYAAMSVKYVTNSRFETINADLYSQLQVERGGLSTTTGEEDNSSLTKNRRIRTPFIHAPFSIEVASGYRLGAILYYDLKSHDFVQTSYFPSESPFTTKFTAINTSYVYRFIITKEDATQAISETEMNGILTSFKGIYGYTDFSVNSASKGRYIKRNTVINYTGESISIRNNVSWDVMLVNVPAGAKKIYVPNYGLARFYCFDSNAVEDFTPEHFFRIIPYSDAYLDIPYGTQIIAVLFRKSDYPNGYGEIQVNFQVKDEIQSKNIYSGERIDLAKTWDIETYKILGASRTVQSMAHWGDRLFMMCNYADETVEDNRYKIKLYVYDLNDGTLIQEFDNIATSTLAFVHCNTAFFGKEYYTGNDKYPLLYVSQWSRDRGLLALNIVENEDRDSYTITPVQVIKPGNNLTDAIGEGYMDYMYDPQNDRLISISYHVANNGYYDTENNAHVAVFDMPLLSDGSSVILNTVIDSFRISPVPVRQDMTIFSGKLYLFSGFGTAEWKSYLTVINVGEKKIDNSILISDVYESIITEPEAVDIINGNLCVTSIINKAIVYRMNFFG